MYYYDQYWGAGTFFHRLRLPLKKTLLQAPWSRFYKLLLPSPALKSLSSLTPAPTKALKLIWKEKAKKFYKMKKNLSLLWKIRTCIKSLAISMLKESLSCCLVLSRLHRAENIPTRQCLHWCPLGLLGQSKNHSGKEFV